MNDTEAAWVAGLLEGEGSFLLHKSLGVSPRVSCQMTDLDVLEKLQEICGGHIYERKRQHEHYKRAWGWHVSGSDAIQVMHQVLKFMGARRSTKIWEVIRAYDGRQAEIETRESNLIKAASYYETMPKKSFRAAAREFGVNYKTLERQIKGYRS